MLRKKHLPEMKNFKPFLSPKMEQENMERVFARVFQTDDGQRVLSYLQYITFGKVLAPTSTDEHLRYSEGQRSIVAMILRMVDRGRNL